MNRNKKLIKNISSIFIGSFATKILNFVFIRFYTEVLTTSEYGVADLIATTVSLLYPFFTIMIDEALMRMLLDKNSDKKEIVTIALRINIIGIFIFLCLSPVILFVPTLKEYYVLFVLYYLSYIFNNFMFSYARGVDRISDVSISGVISSFTIIVCNIVFLKVFSWGIEGYLLSFIIGTSISGVYLLCRTSPLKHIGNIRKIDKQKYKIMLAYAIPLIPNTISWWISNSSDRYLVTGICGAAENGIYSVAYKIPTILTTVYSIFISAWRISAVDEFGSEASRQFYENVYRKVVSGLFLVASGLLVFNRFLASVMYSTEFQEAYLFAPILVVSALYSGLSEFYGTIYTSNKSTIPLFITSIMGAGLNIVLNVILIPFFHNYGCGAMGAAIATLTSYLIIYIIRSQNTKHILDINITFMKRIVLFILIMGQMVVTVMLPSRPLISFMFWLGVLFINIKEIYHIISGLIKKVRRVQ